MNFALVGAPGSGKSSIADALGVRMSFADGVRREVAGILAPITRTQIGRMFGVPEALWPSTEAHVEALMTDMTNPDIKDTYREILQVWGTDFRRAQDPDYWCRALAERIVRSRAEDSSRILVVDDCRFTNEYEMLRKGGFKFVLLESGASTRPLTGAQLAHESEKYWPTFHVDLVLDYQPGPSAQAQRIREAFGETE